VCVVHLNELFFFWLLFFFGALEELRVAECVADERNWCFANYWVRKAQKIGRQVQTRFLMSVVHFL